MKSLLMCLAVLFLSSCILVEDFSSYWDKGVVDSALLGKWKGESGNGNGYDIVEKEDIYQIDSLDEKDRKEEDYFSIAAKTLNVGSYTFLMAFMEGDKKGAVLIRYKKEGDIIQQYSLKSVKMNAFLEEKYPEVKNIKKAEYEKKHWYTFGIRIRKFDKEVYKILLEIPDTRDFWAPDGKYFRVDLHE